jgi:small nuclear ribonucleoprotein
MSQQRPPDLLQRSLDSNVLVKLKGGREIRGKLRGFDMHMNLVLEEAEEIVDDNNTKRLGAIVVRGDNVIMISPPPR